MSALFRDITISGEIKFESQVDVITPTRTGSVTGFEIIHHKDGTAESARVQIDFGDGDREWLPIDRARVSVDRFWG
jgi:hypothetical protein